MATTIENIKKWESANNTKKLEKALKDHNSDIREASISALNSLGWKAEKNEEKASFYIVNNEAQKCLELEDKGIGKLIYFLGHDDLRERIIDTISKIGTEALGPLLDSANFYALHMLSGAEQSITSIAKQSFSQTKYPIKYQKGDRELDLLTEAISAISKEAVPQLMETFKKTKNFLLKFAIIKSFGFIGDTRVEDLLIKTLETKSSFLREVLKGTEVEKFKARSVVSAAAEALIIIDSKKGLDRMIEMLENPPTQNIAEEMPQALYKASVVLKEKDSEKAFEILLKLIKHGGESDYVIDLANEIAEYKDPRAVEPLTSVFTFVFNAFKPSLQEKAQEAAVNALVKTGDSAIEPLMDIVKNYTHKDKTITGWVKENCTLALGKLQAKQALDLIKEGMNENADIKAASAEALGEIGDPVAIPILIKALGEKYSALNVKVPQKIVEALEKFDTPEAKEAVKDYKASRKKKMCFIATAAYNDPLAYEVEILRYYRDDVLINSLFGRLFIKTYYIVSPPIANYLGKHEKLRLGVRKLLDYIINQIESK